MRYDYSHHKTRRAAESALEHYFASGEICAGESPRIESRAGGFVITLQG